MNEHRSTERIRLVDTPTQILCSCCRVSKHLFVELGGAMLCPACLREGLRVADAPDYASCDACGGRFSPDAVKCPKCGDRYKLSYGFWRQDEPSAGAANVSEVRLVHCKRCNKTHAVKPGEQPCAPGAWIDEPSAGKERVP